MISSAPGVRGGPGGSPGCRRAERPGSVRPGLLRELGGRQNQPRLLRPAEVRRISGSVLAPSPAPTPRPRTAAAIQADRNERVCTRSTPRRQEGSEEGREVIVRGVPSKDSLSYPPISVSVKRSPAIGGPASRGAPSARPCGQRRRPPARGSPDDEPDRAERPDDPGAGPRGAAAGDGRSAGRSGGRRPPPSPTSTPGAGRSPRTGGTVSAERESSEARAARPATRAPGSEATAWKNSVPTGPGSTRQTVHPLRPQLAPQARRSSRPAPALVAP